jgi:hypothetical protein
MSGRLGPVGKSELPLSAGLRDALTRKFEKLVLIYGADKRKLFAWEHIFQLTPVKNEFNEPFKYAAVALYT